MKSLSLFKPTLVRRFAISVKEEGWKPALGKAKAYIALVLFDKAPAAIPEFTSYSMQGDNTTSSQEYLTPFWSDISQRSAFHIKTPPAALSKNRSVAVIGDLNLPQCRKYRVEQPAEIWEQLGVKYDFSSLQDLPRAVKILQQATHLIVYRTPNCPLLTMYLYEARRLKLPVLYDIDDPLFSVSAYETYSNMKNVSAFEHSHFVSMAPRYLDAMNMADIISVSTPRMAEHTRLYSSRPVHVRRNFADHDTLMISEKVLKRTVKKNDDTFRVVFASGSNGHEADFASIENSVTTFLKSDKRRKLLILGRFDANLLPSSLGDQIEIKPFSSYDNYLSALATADCNLMPLTYDVFNQCKSGVRLLDSAVVAVPSLVSNIGDLPHLVEDGKTGHVINPNGDWLAALETMAGNKRLCAEMGIAARCHVSKSWVAHTGPPIIDTEIVDWVRQ